ncbi:MAG: NADPH-dependent curcumin reductase CurA [Shewanella sp.]|jgi:NADPH-dependent curcumin reductase CurA
MNKQIVLATRPNGIVKPTDFSLIQTPIPEIGEGEVLLKNQYISMDAGFRYWMNEGTANNVLPCMELGKPVQGIVLGKVIESKNSKYSVGQPLMARIAWEEYSVLKPDNDAVYLVPDNWDCPDSYYLGLLGETGMSAYIGTHDIGNIKPGETALISAAAGAVGCVAGQIAKIMGARVVGITGNNDKASRLINEFGFDAVVNYKTADSLEAAIRAQCPDGIDFYFDSIGGPMLEAAIANLATGARLALCGATNSYSNTAPLPGPNNLFELVTKQATMTGFLTHMDAERYVDFREQLFQWLTDGKLKNADTMGQGIESTPAAFSAIFTGQNFGKSIIKL